MKESASPLFSDVFSLGISGCRGTCHCGREFFDNYNTGITWEDGELDRLHQLAREKPDRYFPCEGSVSFIEIDGLQFVWGCKCGGAARYERFLIKNGTRIAKYLCERAKQLEAEAKALSQSAASLRT